MNISYKWINDLITTDLTPLTMATKLTGVGLAVDGIHEQAGDFVLDVDLTSNRPDCLSHLGVARELGVITSRNLTTEARKYREETNVPMPSILAAEVVKIDDPELCNRFTARVIRGVKIGPSPDWLVNRLEAIGERAINNVADITNYVMHELGQPMHSFDLDKLAENRIVVRRAKVGETIKTLDDVERKLDDTVLAICDAEKPIAVAGVMGGLDSAISDETTNVLLEVAYFKRENIRQTSRKLNLATEASYRFERGVDIENLKLASDRATALICELAGGRADNLVDVYPTRFTPNEIESNNISAAVKRLTGLDVGNAECLRILTALGILIQEQSAIRNPQSTIFTSPSWRHDIAIEEDLVEEVARHAGYANIVDELPPAYGAGEYQPNEMKKMRMRQTLTDLGFDEAISYSFIDTKTDTTFDLIPSLLDDRSEEKFVTLRDSVIEGSVRMRPTLLPGLLDALRLNFNYQRRDVMLFEIGKVFAAKTGESKLPTEREVFSLAVTGGEVLEERVMAARDLDFYDTKGSVEAALAAAGFDNAKFTQSEFEHLRKGQAASISMHGKPIGSLGRLNEEISANYKFKQPVYVAEIDLQAVLAETDPPILYRALPKYPSVVLDVSFIVSRDVSFADIQHAVKTQNRELCRSVNFVDIYEGKGIAADERSITIRLEYRSDERTLIEAEVDAVHEELVGDLETSLGIRRRF